MGESDQARAPDQAADTTPAPDGDPADTTHFEKAIAGRDSLVRALREELQRLTTERDELAGQNEELEDELEEKAESGDYLTGKIGELLDASEQSEKKAQEAEARADVLSARLAEFERTSTGPDAGALAGARAEVERLASRIRDLEAARDGLAGRLGERQRASEAKESELRATRELCDSLKAELERANAEFARRTREEQDREAALVRQIEEARGAAAADAHAREAPEAELEELRRRVSQAEERASYVALKLASESELRAVLEAQRGEWAGSAESAAQNVRRDLEPKLKAATEKLARLEGALAEAERVAERRLGEQHAAEQRALSAENRLLGTIESYKQRATDAEVRATAAGGRLSGAEQRAAEQARKADDAVAELARLREQTARSSEDSRDTVEGLRRDLEAHAARAGQLEERLAAGEAERERMSAERRDLNARLLEAAQRDQDLRARAKKADEDRRTAVAEHGFFEQQIADLKRACDDLQQSAEAGTKKAGRAEADVARMQKKSAALAERYEKLLVKQFDKGVKSAQPAIKKLEKDLRQLRTKLAKLEKASGSERG
jgi:colicin import membrane protein